MEKSALAQEKIWFDKPSYDKAERLYFESMAKVVPHKLMERCSHKSENSVTNDHESILNYNFPQSKTKHEKTKDNKLLTSENIPNDTSKNHKTNKSKSNKYENEYNTQKNESVQENVQEKQKSENVRNNTKKKPSVSWSDMSAKHNVEEVKEKKNKAETRHRNIGKQSDTTEVKGYVPPHKRKEQQENQQTTSPNFSAGGSLAIEVAKAHQYIKESLQYVDDIAVVTGLINPPENMKDNLDGVIEGLRSAINNLEKRVKVLEDNYNQISKEQSAPLPKQTEEKAVVDNDVDLFGSDSEGEDAEAARIREERLAAYAAKKSKKPVLIAKSNIILDVKPWGSDVDMKQMETEVRKIETDGLLWGAAQLVPLAYGIHKLQISCVVEDEKVSVDWLTEEIQQIEDHVQSVDIAAFNKV